MDTSLNRIKVLRLIILFMLIMLIGTMTGCSTFKKTTEANLTPFAEQTITMAGSVNYGFMSVRPVYTRQYLEQTPEVIELVAMTQEIRKIMRGIVAYSIQVVTLSQASKEGPERAQGLADFIEELLKPVVEQKRQELSFDEAKLNEMLENIRKQETLLDALRAAQPLIDEVSSVAEVYFEEYAVQKDTTIEALYQAVDEEFEAVLNYEVFLRETQAYVLTNLELLYEYYKGDDTALETLRQRETPALSKINMDDGLDNRELIQAEDILIERILVINTLRSNIKPRLDMHAMQKKELRDLDFEMNQILQRTKAAVMVWQRTHRAMAAGITYPADINLFDVTKRIVQVALPF